LSHTALGVRGWSSSDIKRRRIALSLLLVVRL